MSSTKPLSVIPRSLYRMVSRSVCYPKERLNSTITLEDGRIYRVFREVIVRRSLPRAGGIFRVWFYGVTTTRQTIALSRMTKPLFYGMPGFRGKLWLIDDESGEFGGIYQFDTVEQARGYANSFAMRLSKRRAKQGMFSMEYYPKDGEASLFKARSVSLPSAREHHNLPSQNTSSA